MNYAILLKTVVDANGNLHIFTLAEGAYSDHIDSIGYVYEYEKCYQK